MMDNGRPQNHNYGSIFCSQGVKLNVDSLTELTDVSGWADYSGQWQEGVSHGNGKQLLGGGRVFTGEFERDTLKEGTLRELQKDNNTVCIYNVTFDAQQDYTNWVSRSKQVPKTKTKTGEEKV